MKKKKKKRRRRKKKVLKRAVLPFMKQETLIFNVEEKMTGRSAVA